MEPKIDLSNPPSIRTDKGIALDCVQAANLASDAEARKEILILSDMVEGERASFHTKNSIYNIEKIIGIEFLIQGGYFPQPTKVNIHGSTWGGSMLLMNRIAVGMNVEIWDDTGMTLTSAVQSWSKKVNL
jgi:hypothetical protein